MKKAERQRETDRLKKNSNWDYIISPTLISLTALITSAAEWICSFSIKTVYIMSGGMKKKLLSDVEIEKNCLSYLK